MDPDNPVVKLCVAGMRAEGEGRLGDARDLFAQAWAARQDDFEASIAAHYVARHQDTPEETLRWNEEALQRAEAVGDERVRGFYPSLYLNLGHSHEMLGHTAEARRFYDLAAERLDEVPGGRLGDMVRSGIENGRMRVSGNSAQTTFNSPGKILKASLAFLLWAAMLSASPVRAQPAGGHTLWLPLVSRANANPLHQGIATYYNATGAGACLFDASPNDLMVAAMNAPEYNNSAVCGEFVSVTGPKGTIRVRIVDLCPECLAGHLDLSQQAFAQIADLPLGVVPITWQVISPPLAGPIAYHFKDGSNQWWTAVQIRNHRNPIAKFEYLAAPNQWVAVPRTSYNYFVQTNPGMGPGPYTFRVTDSYGNVLSDSGIPAMDNGTVNGSGQFPPGP